MVYGELGRFSLENQIMMIGYQDRLTIEKESKLREVISG